LILCAVVLSTVVWADSGKVNNDDRNDLAKYFSARGTGGYGWGDLDISKGNWVNITRADGKCVAIAWSSNYPRMVIGLFSSCPAVKKNMISRTGYGFFGAASIYRQLNPSQLGYDGSSLAWTLTAADQSSNGITVKNLTYTKSFTVDNGQGSTSSVTITVENLIAEQDGSFNVNGNSVTAKVGDAKSFYIVSGWPFLNNSDAYLRLGVLINSNGKGSSNATLSQVGAHFGIGNGIVIVPTTATVDGQPQSINVTMIVDDDGNGNDGSESREFLIMSFPKFTNTLSYDPVNSLTGAATTVTVSSLMSVLLLMMMIIVLNW